MTRPPVGAGRFLLLVAAVGLPFLPAGVYAEDGLLVAHFGPPFELSAPTGIPKAELDEWALRESMGRIARLIPENLRGVYRDAA